MHPKPRMLFVLIGVLLFVTPLCFAATAIPFKPGEKLRYSLYWEDLSAGEVAFDVKPMATISNAPAYHFIMNADISPLLNAVLMIADRIESNADAGMTHALLYKEHRNTAADEDFTVTFDWKKREAQYSSNGKKYKPAALLPGAFDSLSVLYALRLADMQATREIAKPVSNGFDCAVVRAKVIGRQHVRVESGQYDTYLLEPQLSGLSDVFDKISAVTVKLWISTDARRLPVKIVCEFPVGSFRAELKALSMKQ